MEEEKFKKHRWMTMERIQTKEEKDSNKLIRHLKDYEEERKNEGKKDACSRSKSTGRDAGSPSNNKSDSTKQKTGSNIRGKDAGSPSNKNWMR